jgi:hypothetical protein
VTIAGDRVGKPLVKGKNVTGSSDGEEEVGLTKVVPFPLEDEVMSLGATFFTVTGGVHTVTNGPIDCLIRWSKAASRSPRNRLPKCRCRRARRSPPAAPQY